MHYKPNKPKSRQARALLQNFEAIEDCSIDQAVAIIDDYCLALERSQGKRQIEIAELFSQLLSKVYFRGLPTDPAVADGLQDCVNEIIATDNPRAITLGFLRIERVFHFCPDKHNELLDDLYAADDISKASHESVLLSFARSGGRITRFVAENNGGNIPDASLTYIEMLLDDCLNTDNIKVKENLASNIFFIKDSSIDLHPKCDEAIRRLGNSSPELRAHLSKGEADFVAFETKRARGELRPKKAPLAR